MILYVNGDSHSAGAELVENYCFASDDPRYNYLGRRPHPDCIPHSYGYKLSQMLNTGFYLDAESGSSNTRIMRTTRDFLADNRKQDTFVLIGWTSWEREEWLHQDTHYQITASGTDSVPEDLEDKYKQWVSSQDMAEIDRKQAQWHKDIYDLHTELQDAEINHLFFNTHSWFREHVQDKVDWHGCYIEPYTEQGTYIEWCKAQGHNNVFYGSYHYDRSAHTAWAKHLMPRLTKNITSAIIETKTIVPVKTTRVMK